MRYLAYITILLAFITGFILLYLGIKIYLTSKPQVNEWPRERYILECQRLDANKTTENWSYANCIKEFEGVKSIELKGI